LSCMAGLFVWQPVCLESFCLSVCDSATRVVAGVVFHEHEYSVPGQWRARRGCSWSTGGGLQSLAGMGYDASHALQQHQPNPLPEEEGTQPIRT
jgi:hypothetical protein